MTRSYRTVYRIDSPKAVEGWGKLSIRWEPWHQKPPVIRARVITAEGAVHELDPKTISDAPVRENSPEIYTDTRLTQAPLPGVALGSIIEEVRTVEDTEPFFPQGTASRVYMGSGVPVVREVVVINYPSSIPLRYATRNLEGIQPIKEEANGRVRLTFIRPPSRPNYKEPEMLPHDTIVRPLLEITTAASWIDVGQGYARLAEPKIRTGDVQELVKATTEKSEGREDTIRRIVNRLHKDVRYTGVEFAEAKIIPQFPSETLARKYGDCKDKSTLLVAMLRAARIPAYLALVKSSGGLDVNPEMPGMGLFDHAVVYVPADRGQKDWWIDATASYHQAGSIPASIRGKQALVIDGKSQQLTRIPEAVPQDNLLVEKREFFLAEYGAGRAIEVTEPQGEIEAAYRAYYLGPNSKDRKERLEAYAKSMYLSEKLKKIESSDGANLMEPFRATLEMEESRRAYTNLNDALLAVRMESLFGRLPRWFVTEEPEKKKEEEDPEPPRTHDYVFQPFVSEWRYKIHLPIGFQPRELPKSETRAMGPAKFTQEFKMEAGGTLSAVFRFDTLKGRYSIAEAEALRTAVLQQLKGNAVILAFDNTAHALLSQGNIRGALAEHERVAAAHPKEALHRVQISRSLLEAGLGERAREEAELATQLDKDSALAFRNLGWIYEHDLLGRRFEKGFDRERAAAAYLKAKELDPKEPDGRVSLAILYEHDATGERYTDEVGLEKAIAEYKAVKEVKKETYEKFEVNLMYALAYAGRFAELRELIGQRASGENYRKLAVVAAAGEHGATAAITEARRLTANEEDRGTVLVDASGMLLRMRRYPEAAEMLAAGAKGRSNAAALLNQVEMFRRARRAEQTAPNEDAPESVLHKLMVEFAGPSKDETLYDLFTERPRHKADKEAQVFMIRLARRTFLRLLGDNDLPRRVIADLVLSNAKFNAESDGGSGYRVWVQLPEDEAFAAYVVKRKDGYRIVAYKFDESGIGREALALLEQKELTRAVTWLNWLRESAEFKGGDDPLEGQIFARLWEKNTQTDDIAHARAAALAVVYQDETGRDLLPMLEEAAKDAAKVRQESLDILQALAYLKNQEWKKLAPIAERLLATYPKSDFALTLTMASAVGTKQYDKAQKAAEQRLQANKDDKTALLTVSQLLAAQNKVKQSRDVFRARVKMGRADADELNNFAWSALFEVVDDEALDAARRASALTENNNYGILHTLAALYAEVGKTAEARELMLQAMRSNLMEELDSSLWYIFGRIAEQYGEERAAQLAYEKVEEPEGLDVDSTSTFRLARTRMEVLSRDAKAAKTAAVPASGK